MIKYNVSFFFILMCKNLQTADHLSGHAGIIHILNDSPYKLAWDTHFPGDLRAINNSILDMFHLKSLHALRTVLPTVSTVH